MVVLNCKDFFLAEGHVMKTKLLCLQLACMTDHKNQGVSMDDVLIFKIDYRPYFPKCSDVLTDDQFFAGTGNGMAKSLLESGNEYFNQANAAFAIIRGFRKTLLIISPPVVHCCISLHFSYSILLVFNLVLNEAVSKIAKRKFRNDMNTTWPYNHALQDASRHLMLPQSCKGKSNTTAF